MITQVPLFLAADWVHLRGCIPSRTKGGRREVRCLFLCPVPLQLGSSVPTSTAPFSWASSGIVSSRWHFRPGGANGSRCDKSLGAPQTCCGLLELAEAPAGGRGLGEMISGDLTGQLVQRGRACRHCAEGRGGSPHPWLPLGYPVVHPATGDSQGAEGTFLPKMSFPFTTLKGKSSQMVSWVASECDCRHWRGGETRKFRSCTQGVYST